MTDKQQKFCDEYLLSLNATQAAVRAGYSRTTAAATSSRLMKNGSIKNYIEEKQKEAQQTVEISRKNIIEQLSEIGFADIDMKKIRAADKLKALELITKILGIEKPQNDDTEMFEKLLKAFADI